MIWPVGCWKEDIVRPPVRLTKMKRQKQLEWQMPQQVNPFWRAWYYSSQTMTTMLPTCQTKILLFYALVPILKINPNTLEKSSHLDHLWEMRKCWITQALQWQVAAHKPLDQFPFPPELRPTFPSTLFRGSHSRRVFMSSTAAWNLFEIPLQSYSSSALGVWKPPEHKESVERASVGFVLKTLCACEGIV